MTQLHDLLRDLYEPNTPTRAIGSLRRDVEALKRRGFVRRMVEDGDADAVSLSTLAEFPYFTGPNQLIGSDNSGEPFVFDVPQYGFVTRDKTGVMGAGAFGSNSMLARTSNGALAVDDDVYVLNMPTGSTIVRSRENGPVFGDDVIAPMTFAQHIVEVADATGFDHGNPSIDLDWDGPYLYVVNGSANSAKTFNLPTSGTFRPGVSWTILNPRQDWDATRAIVINASSGQQINALASAANFSVTGGSKIGVKVTAVLEGTIGDDRFMAWDWTDRNA
jgi:hypothetical protein